MVKVEISRIFEKCNSVAIVGWSPKAERPSHWISNFLEDHSGWRVFRINPLHHDGEKVFKSLEDLPETVDLIDVFRNPEAVPEVVADALVHGTKAIWLQPGAENEAAIMAAQAAGITAIHSACLYREFRAWTGDPVPDHLHGPPKGY